MANDAAAAAPPPTERGRMRAVRLTATASLIATTIEWQDFIQDTRVRYTGVSLVYQIGAIIFLAPIPILAALLVALDGNQPCWVAMYLLLGCMVSALAASLMRRTFRGPALAAASAPAA